MTVRICERCQKPLPDGEQVCPECGFAQEQGGIVLTRIPTTIEELREFCEYAIKQFDFWTGDEFAVSFRRMITLEQFKSPEKMKLYQDVIAKGPVKYTEDIFGEMLKKGKLSKAAKEMGALKLALELFAPLSLSIQLFDGGEDPKRLRKDLKVIIDGFRKRYTA